MVTIGMNYQMIPGKEKVFEDAFTAVLKVMEEMEGHSKSFLYKDVSNAQSYLIVSEWSDEKAFDTFMASEKLVPAFNASINRVISIVANKRKNAYAEGAEKK